MRLQCSACPTMPPRGPRTSGRTGSWSPGSWPARTAPGGNSDQRSCPASAPASAGPACGTTSSRTPAPSWSWPSSPTTAAGCASGTAAPASPRTSTRWPPGSPSTSSGSSPASSSPARTRSPTRTRSAPAVLEAEERALHAGLREKILHCLLRMPIGADRDILMLRYYARARGAGDRPATAGRANATDQALLRAHRHLRRIAEGIHPEILEYLPEDTRGRRVRDRAGRPSEGRGRHAETREAPDRGRTAGAARRPRRRLQRVGHLEGCSRCQKRLGFLSAFKAAVQTSLEAGPPAAKARVQGRDRTRPRSESGIMAEYEEITSEVRSQREPCERPAVTRTSSPSQRRSDALDPAAGSQACGLSAVTCRAARRSPPTTTPTPRPSPPTSTARSRAGSAAGCSGTCSAASAAWPTPSCSSRAGARAAPARICAPRAHTSASTAAPSPTRRARAREVRPQLELAPAGRDREGGGLPHPGAAGPDVAAPPPQPRRGRPVEVMIGTVRVTVTAHRDGRARHLDVQVRDIGRPAFPLAAKVSIEEEGRRIASVRTDAAGKASVRGPRPPLLRPADPRRLGRSPCCCASAA